MSLSPQPVQPSIVSPGALGRPPPLQEQTNPLITSAGQHPADIYKADIKGATYYELPPAYAEPTRSPVVDRQPRWPRALARWVLAAVYLALIFTILHISSCYSQVFLQLVRTQGALEVADRRSGQLAERVAWLESRLSADVSVGAGGELTSALTSDSDGPGWIDDGLPPVDAGLGQVRVEVQPKEELKD